MIKEIWHSLKPEIKRDDKDHLDYIRQLPCVVCKSVPSEAHHLLRLKDKSLRGMSMKAPDCKAVPLCNKHHSALHFYGNEIGYFDLNGLRNLEDLADLLYLTTGDVEAGASTVLRWKNLQGNYDGKR